MSGEQNVNIFKYMYTEIGFIKRFNTILCFFCNIDWLGKEWIYYQITWNLFRVYIEMTIWQMLNKQNESIRFLNESF